MLRRTRPALRGRSALPLLVAAIGVLPVAASAHAALLESTPRDGEVLTAPPPVAVLRFNSRVEKGLTRVVLAGADGRVVPLTPAPEGEDDPPDRISVPLPVLAPGAYQLKYRVLAADGHATPGLIRFTVEAAGAAR
jgi:methionine-rich copper-binding protein CopC